MVMTPFSDLGNGIKWNDLRICYSYDSLQRLDNRRIGITCNDLQISEFTAPCYDLTTEKLG